MVKRESKDNEDWEREEKNIKELETLKEYMA
jgi:hypothetical protein